MYTLCWSPKGGSGTTVTAATIALAASTATLVDLGGDAPGVLGLGTGSEGVLDWMRSGAEPDRLDDLAVDIDTSHHLWPTGRAGAVPARRWSVLANYLAERTDVIVDAGTTRRPPAPLLQRAQRRLMILRPCYLALRAASEAGVTPDGIIVINEAGRALSSNDVQGCLGVQVVAEVMVDPSVARAVDAGLLTCRSPRSLAPIQRLSTP